MILVTIINRNLDMLIPLIHEFKKEIKKHIIFYDIEDQDIAKRLKQGINSLFKTQIKLIAVDEDSKKDMIKIQNELKKESDKLYLNATNSDLSLITIISGYILQNGGIVLAYDKKDNTYNKISKESFENIKIKNNLTLRDYFTYKCINFQTANIDKHIVAHKDLLFNIFENSYKLFKEIEYIQKKKIDFLEKDRKKAYKILKILDQNSKKIGSFGKLFEYFIYLKLNEYSFDDIWINSVLEFENSVTNEFDVVAIKDNRIFLIECKLGNEFDPISVIYKFDSLLENVGIDTKGLIINIHSTKNGKSFLNKQFSDQLNQRAKQNSIEVYNDYFFNEAIFNEKITNFFEVELKYKKELKNEPIFLLGGKDLEMEEIKNLLIKHNKRFLDKRLEWGAKLSYYRHLLDDKNIYYGIELIEDIAPPKNYIAIDHHNSNQANLSSLEQVAKILGIELNRYQKLVSLNDKGYIKAMKDFGATEVEIEYIRQKDREAQGVDENDEVLATISLQEAKLESDILIIKAKTDKFSAISDKCYDKYENILIYNDKKLSYYGKGIKQLVKEYEKDIKKQKAYYGGNFGYFGLSEGRYKEIKKEVKRIKEIVKGIPKVTTL